MKSNVRKILIGTLVAVTMAVGSVSALAGQTRQAAASSSHPKLFSMLPAAIQHTGVISLATNGQSAPCESFAKKNTQKLVGYEADLWNAMGKVLGVTIKPTSLAFDSLIPGVQSHRFDLGMSCLSDNPAREKVITFVDDAYATGAVFTLKANHTVTANPLSLCGQTTAIVAGEDFAQNISDVLNPHCTKAGKSLITVSELPSTSAVVLALYAGRINFALEDIFQVKSIVQGAPHPVRYVLDSLLDKYYNGMVFPKDSTQLEKAMLAALKAVHANGEYLKILTKWGFPGIALDHPGINLAKTNPIPAPKP